MKLEEINEKSSEQKSLENTIWSYFKNVIGMSYKDAEEYVSKFNYNILVSHFNRKNDLTETEKENFVPSFEYITKGEIIFIVDDKFIEKRNFKNFVVTDKSAIIKNILI